MLHRILAILPALFLVCCGVCHAWTGARVINDETPPPDQQAIAADSYAVQVGRFSEEEKALQLAKKLREKGYTPHVLSAGEPGGQVWYAVRLSLHDSLDQARQAARKFSEAESRHAMVAISGSTNPVPAAANVFFLQTGAFLEQENAEKLLQQHKEQGYTPGIVKLYDQDKKPFHIVYIGVYESYQDATDVAKAFQEKTGAQCFINAIAPQLFQQRQVNVGE